MAELHRALAELRRLGVHLDPGEAAEAARRRRLRLNTRVYPLTRALGFQLLIAATALHDLAIFGRVAWGPLLAYAAIAELYVLLSWLALRRWFETFPRVRGWDLSDVSFIADLVLWLAAIGVTGGPASLLWPLPLLRVADHHASPKAWTFAHLGPVGYLLLVLAFAAGDPAAVAWPGETFKVLILYAAGLYIAFTGRPALRFRQQREAAVSTASALLRQLTERTERLDQANRSRSVLLDRLGTGIRTSLVEIVGFSAFLLRSDESRPRSDLRYIERIHDEARDVLRLLDDLASTNAPGPGWPRVSLNGLLQKAAAEEAQQSDDWRESARLVLPFSDAEIHADATRVTLLLRHLLAASRHFAAGAPTVELELDAATGLPEAVAVRVPRRPGRDGGQEPPESLFNPFAERAAGDQKEMGARLELSMARSLGQAMGYKVEVEPAGEGLALVVRLR